MPWVQILVLIVVGLVGFFVAGWRGAVVAVAGYVAGKVF